MLLHFRDESCDGTSSSSSPVSSLPPKPSSINPFFGPREKLWRHLQKIKTPQHLRDIIQSMYTGCLYLLIDGDKISEEVAPTEA